MAKGQHLSRHQQGIVKRYYEHKDTLMLQKLGEVVSELYLATGNAKKSDRLWKQARTALANTSAKPEQIERICNAQDVAGLAELVARLAR